MNYYIDKYMNAHVCFWRCKSGNFAITFAIILLVILGAVGLAIDFFNISSVKSKAQDHLDAAVLSSVTLGKDDTVSISDVEGAGLDYFITNIEGINGVDIKTRNITYDSAAREAEAAATIEVSNRFMGLFGFGTTTIAVQSTAMGGGSAMPMDISLMLDVSGSMAGSKLTGLKSAVTDFLKAVIGEGQTSPNTKVGFVPFSSSVNAGLYSTSLSAGSTPENCVAGRSGANAFTDAPASLDMFSVDGEHAISDDENGGVYRVAHFNGYTGAAGSDPLSAATLCPDAEIFPLTGNYNSLVSKLSTYDAAGITAGHLGIAYSWYIISEKWSGFWPAENAPRPNSDAMKVAVLMSDGQFNTYYHSVNGLPDDQGLELCNNMKADGVKIFSISFDTDGTSEDLLQSCASEPDYFYNADSISELASAFAGIASHIVVEGVRISN